MTCCLWPSLFHGTDRNGTEQFRRIISRNGSGTDSQLRMLRAQGSVSLTLHLRSFCRDYELRCLYKFFRTPLHLCLFQKLLESSELPQKRSCPLCHRVDRKQERSTSTALSTTLSSKVCYTIYPTT